MKALKNKDCGQGHNVKIEYENKIYDLKPYNDEEEYWDTYRMAYAAIVRKALRTEKHI